MSFRRRKYTLKCNDSNTFDQCEPYEVILLKGIYRIECVGASGNAESKNDVGYGAKVSGVIALRKETKLYVYVGGKGSTKRENNKICPGGYNGGGSGGFGYYDKNTGQQYRTAFSGGGATDVRTVKGEWNNSLSLDSRIIVAGAGGAGSFSDISKKGGDAGALEGFPSSDYGNNIIKGATQSEGYAKGAGQDGASKTEYGSYGCSGNSGAGGGWYGGFASQRMGDNSISGAGGGSSFVSGYEGLHVINNYKFTHVRMEGGNITKYEGDGYAIITNISSYTLSHQSLSLSFICFILLLSTFK